MADFKRAGHWRTLQSGEETWVSPHEVSRSDFGSSSAECEATNKVAQQIRFRLNKAGDNSEKIAEAWLVLGAHIASIAFRNDKNIFTQEEIENLDDAHKRDLIEVTVSIVRSFDTKTQRKLGLLMGDEKDKFSNFYFREAEHTKLTRVLRNRFSPSMRQKLRIFVKPSPDEE